MNFSHNTQKWLLSPFLIIPTVLITVAIAGLANIIRKQRTPEELLKVTP